MSKNLKKAKKNKNDEFYTQLDDIVTEMKYYKKHFKGKTIFCNCDDPLSSNFWEYFALNFEYLGLKKLISTHFEDGKPSYKLVKDANNPKHVKYEAKEKDIDAYDKTALKENGDFRNPECIELLKEADIVVTNPPFSLFREYVAQLVEYDKKFLIIGNMNAITYKEIFPLLKSNKMWLGINTVKEFVQPDGTIKKFGNINWFTNLTHKKRNEELLLHKEYVGNEKSYPKYDNYDAINVDKVADIPIDYHGVMGVPVTFLGKYNPTQFKILGCNQRGCHKGFPDTKKYNDYWEMRQNGDKTGSSGNKTNENPNLVGNDGKKNYFINKDGHIVQTTYTRIFIKRK